MAELLVNEKKEGVDKMAKKRFRTLSAVFPRYFA